MSHISTVMLFAIAVGLILAVLLPLNIAVLAGPGTQGCGGGYVIAGLIGAVIGAVLFFVFAIAALDRVFS